MAYRIIRMLAPIPLDRWELGLMKHGTKSYMGDPAVTPVLKSLYSISTLNGHTVVTVLKSVRVALLSCTFYLIQKSRYIRSKNMYDVRT